MREREREMIGDKDGAKWARNAEVRDLLLNFILNLHTRNNRMVKNKSS